MTGEVIEWGKVYVYAVEIPVGRLGHRSADAVQPAEFTDRIYDHPGQPAGEGDRPGQRGHLPLPFLLHQRP